ncbi:MULTISPECIES: helix-turn-helix domain-containing protein [Halorhodospira]|nr:MULTISPECIES: helix-turn-helix domain-containing protein [Halorhodospira]MCG5528628.1 helix-turn-helix domain-containing protein [Halorhodospira halophila]
MSKENFYIIIAGEEIGADELVNGQMAAKITGLSVRQLQRLRLEGRLPYYQYSDNCIRYLVRDIVEFSEYSRHEKN